LRAVSKAVRFPSEPPVLVCSVPQLPEPTLVVNESRVKLEVAQVHRRVVVVVVAVVIVVVVAPEHGIDCGWQRSVMLVLACFAFPRILQLLACFFAFTVTPAKLPHTELVPLALTFTFPIFPAQNVGLAAWVVLFLRSCGVQLASGWLTHSPRLNVHLLPTAFAQMVPPSVTVPLVCSWNWVGHWPCAWAARGASARIATHAKTDASAAPDLW